VPKVKKKDKPEKRKKGHQQEDALEDFDLTGGNNDAFAEPDGEEEANGDNGGDDYSTEITQEGIKTATESRAGLFLFFRNDGDRYVVQFLNDLMKGVKVWRHEDYQQSVKPTTCLRRVYKKPCALCTAGIGGSDWFVWNVLDLKEKKVKILALKGSGAGGKALRQLAAEKKENGTLLGTTFILAQEGSKQTKQITVTRKDLDPATTKKIKKLVDSLAEQKNDLMATLKPRVMPMIQARSRSDDEAIVDNGNGGDDEFQIE
jgi:hypothetical protein